MVHVSVISVEIHFVVVDVVVQMDVLIIKLTQMEVVQGAIQHVDNIYLVLILLKQ